MNEKEKNKFRNYVLESFDKEIDFSKTEACFKIIDNLDKFQGDYDNVTKILNSIINTENDNTIPLCINFVNRFLIHYDNQNLSENERIDINTRIAEGTALISSMETLGKVLLSNQIINKDRIRNLGEVCLYLRYISRVNNDKQINSLSGIIANDKIAYNKLDCFAAHLVWDAKDEDLSEIDNFLDFSDRMSDELFETEIKKLSKNVSKSRVRA